jgi:hypothetical protein
MSGFEITCANRSAQGMITRIGGDGWSLEAREAIVKLISNQLRLTVRTNGNYVQVGVRGEGFDAYLALEPDGFPLHKLTDLPSC